MYVMIVPKDELEAWLAKGWVETKHFYDIHYAPKATETYILGKPPTLLDIDRETLLGRKIAGFESSLGSYGMGGPGFFGLILDDEVAQTSENSNRDILVYAVWGAGEYSLIDNRVVRCHAVFYDDFHPWYSHWADEDIPNWDDLTPVLVGTVITSFNLYDDRFVINLSKNGESHQMEFLKNDTRLPPLGSMQPRQGAFKQGVIGQYLVIQKEKAVLYT